MNKSKIAKILFTLSAIFLILGVVLYFWGRINPGSLPGDIFVTSLSISLFFSLIAYFFRR